MTFSDLMKELLKIKNHAKQLGLKDKDIQNLQIVDTGILTSVVKKNYEISLAQKGITYYLLIREKK
jgi:hypothetical protein